jgi:hypothetical protein
LKVVVEREGTYFQRNPDKKSGQSWEEYRKLQQEYESLARQVSRLESGRREN